MSSSRRSALLFALPFLIVGLFDVCIVERPYNLGQGDGIEAAYGLSLNFATGHPKPDAHHPGYLSSQLGGWIIRLSGRPESTLSRFAAAGTCLHLFALVIAAAWTGGLASKLNLPAAAVFVIGLTAAAMPTMITYSRGWGYFTFALFTVPAALGLLKVVLSPRNSYREVFLPFFALGVIFANNLHSSFVVFGLTAGFMASLSYGGKDGLANKLGPGGSGRRLLGWGTLAAAGLFSFSFWGTHLFPASLFTVAAVLIAFGFGASRPMLPRLALAVETPLLFGWTAGVNRMAGYWGSAFVSAAADKGGNTRLEGGFFESAHVGDFLALSAWTWLLGAALAVGVIAGVRALRRRGADKGAVFSGVAILAAMGAAFPVVWRYLFLPWNEMNPSKVGSHLEFVCLDLALPALGLAWLSLNRPPRKLLFGLLSLVVAVCGLSLHQFHALLSERVASIRKLNEVMDRFFWSDPGARLICDRAFRPDVCGTLYAYNRFYRTPESRGALNRRKLLGGRVLYAEGVMDCDLRTHSVKDCYPGMAARPTSLLIAYRQGGRRVRELGVDVWDRKFFKDRLLLVDRKLLASSSK